MDVTNVPEARPRGGAVRALECLYEAGRAESGHVGGRMNDRRTGAARGPSPSPAGRHVSPAGRGRGGPRLDPCLPH
ncbi:hypothetical protein GCM10010106_26830 [Thermopolyspora flexuosa]|nr:hypothetical protein GCM10010106_26830 [Thermopolyspora flexuosa]